MEPVSRVHDDGFKGLFLDIRFPKKPQRRKAFNDPVINQVSVLDHIKTSKTFYCDGLLLLATKDSRLLVWNPYLKQIRRIRPRNSYSRLDRYAFGYENKNNNRNHKILRFIDDHFFTDQVMKPLTGFQFDFKSGSFFIHEEKKIAVVFDLDGYKRTETRRYQTAHIIGEDGYYKPVNIGEATDLGYPGPIYCVPLVCSSS